MGAEFVRGRLCYGPSLSGAEFVRGRDVPESNRSVTETGPPTIEKEGKVQPMGKLFGNVIQCVCASASTLD